MISFLKKLIKVGAVSNFESISDVTEIEYSKLLLQIKEHGWQGFNSKKNFESYEKIYLKVIKYQNKTNIDDEILLLTLGNYFYIKTLTFIAIESTFHEIAFLFRNSIGSYVKSIEYLQNPQLRLTLLDTKIHQLKSCLRKFFVYISKNISEDKMLSVDMLRDEFIDSDILDSAIEKIGRHFFAKELSSINHLKKFHSFFDLSERLAYFQSIFDVNKLDDIPIYILQKTVLNPYKYKILNYEFTDIAELNKKVDEDLVVLEKYKDKIEHSTYPYLRCQFLVFKNTGLSKLLETKEKTLNTFNILEIISAAINGHMVSEQELINLQNQRQFFLMNYHYQKILLLVKEGRHREVIGFVKKIIKTSEWYKSKKFIDQSDDNVKTKLIIELCFFFFYSVFKKQDYLTLESYKPICLKYSITNRLFNLVQAKFALKACGISYPVEDKNLESVLLLKLKEILLKESFDVTFKEFNQNKEQEDSLISLINSGEGNDLEFKASFTADINKYLFTNKVDGYPDYRGDYIEAIAQFLNTKGGKVVIGVWEVDKVPDVAKKHVFLLLSNKIPGYCLTGVDLDLKYKNISLDDIRKRFDEAIIKYIKPNPFVSGDQISLRFYKLFGRDIGIIEVPKGKTYYHYLGYIEDKNGMQNEVYKFFIRKNHGKLELKRPDEDEYVKMNPR